MFQNSKERLMVDDGERLPTQFERKNAIRNKLTETEVRAPDIAKAFKQRYLLQLLASKLN